MIIVNIFGGFGNQLFQYAFARALQRLTGQQITFDISSYESYAADHEKFYLDSLSIDFGSITVMDNKRLVRKIAPVKSFTSRLFSWSRTPRALKIIFQKFAHIIGLYFDKYIPHSPNISVGKQKNIIAHGYFQSEVYFHEVRELVKVELSPNASFEFRDSALAKKISNSTSVAVHIRRGDYVTTHDGNYHLVCTPDWYERAIEKMISIHPDASFFFFSDDPDWVRENIKLPTSGIVVERTDTIHDFNLMRLCRHFIISNSSYSWWAQWLCDNDRKTVITPDRWFSFDNPNKKYKIYDNQDWIILET